MTEQSFDAPDAGAHLIPGYVAAQALYAPVSQIASHHHGLLGAGAAVGAAAQFEAETAGIAASARISGQSIAGLRGEVRGLAAEFPIGIAGARAYVGIVQQLGITSAGSVSQVGALSKVLVELNGATGTGPELALGFGQLNRQLASLDPSRLRRFSDSLVYLQAKGGGSADGIVSFARQIAPFAQQAGIGETAVLGIASSFSKLGDEGLSAGTAVDRVLSDISRSVKTGSNDIAAYAYAVGLTVKQFRALYDANPTGALEKVVTALGSGGGRAAGLLEQRGLDGVRTVKALQELSASGGLSQSIALAQAGYGSGATQKAATAAYDTLDAQLQKLKSTAGEAGAALGGPLANGLSAVLKLAEVPVRAGAHLLNTGPAQDILTGAAVLAGAGVLGVKAFGKLGPLALATELVRSGPVAAAIGGLRQGNGRGAFDPDSFRGRAYNSTMAAGAARSAGEPLGTGPLAGIRGSIYDFTYGVGAARQADLTTARESLVARYARRGVTLGSGALAGYTNLARMPFHLAFTPAEGREFPLTTPGGATRAFGTEISTALRDRDFSGARKALHEFEAEVGGTGKAVSRVTRAFGQAAVDLTTFTARGGYGAARGAISGIASAAGGFLTGTGGLMVAGAIGYGAYQSAAKERSQYNIADQELYAELNRYRDSLGLAGVAATTFADQAKAAALALNGQPSLPTNYAMARRLSTAQIGAVGTPQPDSNKHPRSYSGTDAQIARQIEQLHLTGGLTPADLYAVGSDLYKQGFSQQRVDSILGQVNVHGTPRLTTTSIRAALEPAARAAHDYSPSLSQQFMGGVGGVVHSGGALLHGHLANPLPRANSSIGKDGSPVLLGKTAKTLIDRLVKAMGDQYARDLHTGGPLYAMQSELRTANMIQAQADSFGNADVSVYTAKQLSDALSGSAVNVSASDVFAAGGNIAQLTADHGHKFAGETLSQLQRKGLTLSGTGVVAKPPGLDDVNTIIRAVRGGGVVGTVTTSTAGALGQALAGSAGHPDDSQKLTDAIHASLGAALRAGASWNQIANEAGRIASSTGDIGQPYQLRKGIEAYAEQVASARLPFLTPGAQVRQQVNRYDAQVNYRGPDAATENAQGRQGLIDLRNSLADQYRARIMAQYAYQVGVQRAEFDFHRSELRAEEDYQRQLLYAQQDFQRQRYRSIRDFNIQVSRQQQDLAGSAYDPYQRIEVRPVWDAYNLLGNAQEQLTAMRTQVRNIGKLKALGLDDAVIRQLGLYRPENAQEAQQLVDDLTTNRTLVTQFNNEASKRDKVAGQLLAFDPGFKRQVADFKRQLRDASSDYDRQTTRMATEFHTAMRRAAEDQQTLLSRMAEDLHNADLQITGDFAALQKDLNKVLHGQELDWKHQLINGLQSTLDAIHGFGPRFRNAYGFLAPHAPAAPSGPSGSGGGTSGGAATNLRGGWSAGGQSYGNAPLATPLVTKSGQPVQKYALPGSGKVYHGGLEGGGYNSNGTVDDAPDAAFQNQHPAKPAYNKQIAKSMKPGWATGANWKALEALWTVESGWNQYANNPTADAYGIPQSHPGNKMAQQSQGGGKDWRTNPATQIRWGLDYIARSYGNPWNVAVSQHLFNRDGSWPSPLYKGYADGGIATRPHFGMVAERGVAEAMIPLDPRGVKALAGAMRQYIGDADARVILTGGRAAGVLIHVEEHHYDNRVDLTGAEVTVVSDDPTDMGRKIAARTRRDNLTSPRGVRWSRTPGATP